MESQSPETGRCIPHNSKKRVFPESSSCMEAESSSSEYRNSNCKNKMIKRNEDANISSACSGVMQIDSEDGISNSHDNKDHIDMCVDDYVSEDKYACHTDSTDLHTINEASNPQFSDSIKMKSNMTNDTEIVQSTHPDLAMGDPNLQAGLDSMSHKHKGVKILMEPCKSTKISVGFPSLHLQKGAMKVQYVKKLLKVRHHKVPSGPGGSSYNAPKGDGQDMKNQGQNVIMEDQTLDQDSGENKKVLNRSASSVGKLSNEEVLRMYQNFKKFDIVEDHSDHHYSKSSSAAMEPPRKWAKKIQDEWRILKKSLPEAIFVRVYESRMDLLRAVIMGADGTPYHDGLFFFDVCFPEDYPCSPPRVHYHSGGLRINPNLYDNGKVCLSLLNTWAGTKNETWRPDSSTMLQVLVSIQGLILNAKPYYNEPGDAVFRGSVHGESQSRLYNERALVLSLKTMVYTMKKPSKHFEDMVIGHFRERAHRILTTCKAYTIGTGIGFGGEVRGSQVFKADVERYMKTLIGAFKLIGVEDVDQFLPPTKSLMQKIRAFFGMA